MGLCLPVAVHAAGVRQAAAGELGCEGAWSRDVPCLLASWEAVAHWSTLLSFSSQYMAFFEFNNRLEAILSKAYIYR